MPQSPLVLGIPNLDEEQEFEERERQRLRDELKLSKLGSTDSHGLQVSCTFPLDDKRYPSLIRRCTRWQRA